MTPVQFLNQHSYVVAAGTLLALLAVMLRVRRARGGWLIWLGLAGLAAAGWLALRTGESARFTAVADYEAALRTGTPTLVEFYSDY